MFIYRHIGHKALTLRVDSIRLKPSASAGKSVKDVIKLLKTNSIVSTCNSFGYPIIWQV